MLTQNITGLIPKIPKEFMKRFLQDFFKSTINLTKSFSRNFSWDSQARYMFGMYRRISSIVLELRHRNLYRTKTCFDIILIWHASCLGNFLEISSNIHLEVHWGVLLEISTGILLKSSSEIPSEILSGIYSRISTEISL